jgi:arylsulfatase A-like enzyme
MPRPNIVLICVDQWRGDCLSVAGHPVVHTPYLDRMAMNGARFDRAYSATPTCIPARAALFTGLSQRTHGRVGYEEGIPWDYPVTIASEFTRQCYQTQAVGKMHVHPARNRLGFDHVVLHDGFVHYQRHGRTDFAQIDDYMPWLRLRAGSEADHIDHGVDCNSHVARPWDKPEHLHPTNYVTSESIDFLRRRDPTRPFFLYMSFHRPHPPFDPPAWALEQYLDTSMPEVPRGDWLDEYAQWRQDSGVNATVARLRPDIQQRCRAGYFGHITHIDHQLDRFVEALSYYDLRKDTVLCFVSDHGELLGDHDLWHKRLPYEGSARIPMIFEGPGIKPGQVLEQPMELRDVMPTLLDCAGLEIPSCVEGKSALPIMRGVKQDGAGWRDYLHGEHTGFNGSSHYLTDGKEKYVWLSWSGREQLFDLQNDPQELHDLAQLPAHAARVTVWRERLLKELDGREEGYVQNGKLAITRDVPAVMRHLLERTVTLRQ